MVSSLAFLVALQAPAALPDRATRLDAFLKAASAAERITLRAGPSVANRIVVVAGSAPTPEALRTELAHVLYGRWRQVGEEWVIDEDPAAVRAREERRLASRIAQVKTQQAAMREADQPFDAKAAKALLTTLEAYDAAQKQKGENTYNELMKIEKAIPANAALRRVIVSLDPREIAALEVGNVVYSDRPTRLERPLPASAAQAVRSLERDQAVWAQFYPDNSAFMEAHRTTGWLSMDPRGYPDPPAPGSLHLFLKVRAYEHGQTMFSASFVESSGRVRQFGDISIDFGNGDGRDDPAPKIVEGEPKIVLSPLAHALSEARRGNVVASPEVKNIFLHADRQEPLDVLQGEGLRAIAQARHTRVVAWLGDDAMNFTAGEKGHSPGGWLLDLYGMNYEVNPSADQILVRPRFAAENEDRPALAAFLRIANEKGYVPLDDMADYAVRTSTRSTYGPSLTMVGLQTLIPESVYANRADWRMLSLWGGFTRPQRAALINGAMVPWGQIGKPQVERLTRAILDAESYEMRNDRPGRNYMSLDQEPTQVLAGGFSFGDGVQGTGSTSLGVLARSTDDNPYSGGMASPSALAMAVLNRQKQPEGQRMDGLPKVLPGEYVPGQILRFGVQLRLTPSLTWSKQSEYGEFDVRTKPMPVEALSDEFRKAYNQALENNRNRPPIP